MDRTLQRCLISSTAAHGALLLLLLFLGTVATRKAIEPDVPVMELIPTNLRLTMGDQIVGGTPNPLPPAAHPSPPPRAATPAKPIAPPQPQPAAKVESRPVEPTPPIRHAPTKVDKIEVPKDLKSTAKAQDVDPHKLAEKPVKTAPAIQVSSVKKKRIDDDQKAQREGAEQAAAAAEREERLAAAHNLAARLSGAATEVSKSIGGSTQIEMPGLGGVAIAPYEAWLQAFLKQQWRRPATSSEQQAEAIVKLTIARDGTLLGAEIISRSGVAALDASVEELFRRVRQLHPLPDEFKESQLVIRVKFVLLNDASL